MNKLENVFIKELLIFFLLLVTISIITSCTQQNKKVETSTIQQNKEVETYISKKVETNNIDCNENQECFNDAVENCSKATMKETYPNFAFVEGEIVDINASKCNIQYSVNLNPELSSWFKQQFTKMSEPEFQDLIDDVEEKYEIKISKDEIVKALGRELTLKQSKADYLLEQSDEEENIQPKNEDLVILDYLNIIPLGNFGHITLSSANLAPTDVKATPKGLIFLLINENYLYNLTDIHVEVKDCGSSNAPSRLETHQTERFNISCSLTGKKFVAPIIVKYKLDQINKNGIGIGRIITNIEPNNI